MRKLVAQPFWLDPSDRIACARPCSCWPVLDYYTRFDLRHREVAQEGVWEKAVHRVVTEGISPEQAVDNAIVRDKQIPSE
jgi:hypothetical protein